MLRGDELDELPHELLLLVGDLARHPDDVGRAADGRIEGRLGKAQVREHVRRRIAHDPIDPRSVELHRDLAFDEQLARIARRQIHRRQPLA